MPMQAQRGGGDISPTQRPCARGKWVVNSSLRPLPPQQRTGTHCMGGWMGLMADLAGTGNLSPTGIRSRDRPVRSESLYCLFPRGKAAEAWNWPPPSSVEAKNKWSYASTPICVYGVDRNNFIFSRVGNITLCHGRPVACELRVGRAWLECKEAVLGLIWGTTLAFSRRNWVKPQKLRIDGSGLRFRPGSCRVSNRNVS